MNFRQLAEYLGYRSVDTIYRQTRKPDFPIKTYYHMGRRVVRRDEVDAYIASLTAATDNDAA